MSFFENGKFKKELRNLLEPETPKVPEKPKREGEFTMSEIRDMFKKANSTLVESKPAWNRYNIKYNGVLLVDLMVTKNPRKCLANWEINVSSIDELTAFDEFRREKESEFANIY